MTGVTAPGQSFDPARAFSLAGRTIIVTGGGRGIGRAVAMAMARAGARPHLFDKDGAAADRVVGEITAAGGQAFGAAVDVSQEAEVEAAVARVVASDGRIDCLVNNAGMAIRRPATELAIEDWRAVVDVNLTGVFLCARSVARVMIERRAGSIINTSSIMGLSGGGLYPNISYQATKGALVNLTRALAVEWAPHNVRVNAIAPTWVRTDFIKPLTDDPDLLARMRALTPLGRIAEVEDVVGGVFYLAGDASAMVTGHTLAIDGGFLAQ